jgi:NAD(P)-dependent dehydrogenase (short-subunit alcohol dehydrogenase family)
MATVLVTGANRGIGLELVRRYAGRGEQVIACCRDAAGADALSKVEGDVQVHEVAIGEASSVAGLQQRLGERPIDILINNAGMAGPAPARQSALDMDWDGWLETFAINTLAPLRLVQTLLPNLKAGFEPKAVTITSQLGALSLNWPMMYAYCASKAAVNKVMRMLSADLAKDGITVLLVHPGHVKTDMGGPNAEISVQESGSGIVSVVDRSSLAQTGSFLKWNGEPHDW